MGCVYVDATVVDNVNNLVCVSLSYCNEYYVLFIIGCSCARAFVQTCDRSSSRVRFATHTNERPKRVRCYHTAVKYLYNYTGLVEVRVPE